MHSGDNRQLYSTLYARVFKYYIMSRKNPTGGCQDNNFTIICKFIDIFSTVLFYIRIFKIMVFIFPEQCLIDTAKLSKLYNEILCFSSIIILCNFNNMIKMLL